MSNVNIEYLSRRLREKQQELLSDLARRRTDARAAGQPEVRDPYDSAEATLTTAEAMEEITLESRTLEQVTSALERMEQGTYGSCVICGRLIADARLEAVPWTPYCLDHAPN
ncbi:MAG TPA: TraR/DksA C4-type zinc finger protein [Bryobacteraceae bacterium]|nr:TraR/DksA C4-type zinc finger protein [Bryobacteraceae bacterium]